MTEKNVKIQNRDKTKEGIWIINALDVAGKLFLFVLFCISILMLFIPDDTFSEKEYIAITILNFIVYSLIMFCTLLVAITTGFKVVIALIKENNLSQR